LPIAFGRPHLQADTGNSKEIILEGKARLFNDLA
jgi:hypothetical protein